jgi:hypothetical protein
MMYAMSLFMILAMLPGPVAARGLRRGPEEPRSGCDPALAALFTPPRPAMGRYEVCTTAVPLESVVAAHRSEGAQFGAIEALNALDAFGMAGPYDRSQLARLYGGARASAARGWRQDGDRFISMTVISPYPDATLTHLNRGTMEIRFIVR